MMAVVAISTPGATSYRIWPSQPTSERGEKTYIPSHSKLDQGYVVTLSGQLIQGYILVRPLSIVIEQDEQGMFLASDTVSTVFGYGETGTAALDDYVISFVEYYELLEESESLEAVRTLDALRVYLVRVDA